jgi:hypothetical protein
MCKELKFKCSTSHRSDVNDYAITSMVNNARVLFHTLKVKLKSDRYELPVLAFIFNGSQISKILKDTAERMSYVLLREKVVYFLLGCFIPQRI